MSMCKVLVSLIGLVLVLTIWCSNTVESRMIHRNFEHLPASGTHYYRFGKGRRDVGNQFDSDESLENLLQKRKSDVLLSLYGLPYSLVNKRNQH